MTLLEPRYTEEPIPDVRPLELVAYLRAHGWQERQRDADRYSVWTLLPKENAADDFFEALVPLRKEFRDYDRRIAELLTTLEQAERRPRAEILESLHITNADVVELRLLGERVIGGSIPIEDGVRLSQCSRDLILAAACAVLTPRAAYSTRKPQTVVDYMKTVRTGQTRQGSYVVTVLSPVEPDLQPVTEAAADPFSRRVMHTLLNALHATASAARRAASDGSHAPFEESIERGVSANLCEAVSDLVEIGGEGVEIGCSWSLSRRVPLADRVTPVRFSPDIVPYMRAAARAFRARSANEDAEIRGFVERLNRGKDETTGTVHIVGTVDGVPRRVIARLSGDFYQLALRAHAQKRGIVCFGDVVKEGGRYRLRSARDVSVDIE